MAGAFTANSRHVGMPGESRETAPGSQSYANPAMLRSNQQILQLLKADALRRFYASLPELTEIRYPNLKRGNYSRLSPDHIKFFKSLLGEERVLQGESEVMPYNVDFAKHVRGRSEVVLKPRTTEEVSELLKFCNENNLGVCPQGGNTGLVSGSVPVFDEVVLSTALMNRILHLDEFSGAVTCQSGCILEVVDNYVQERGLIMPLDLGAKASCHLGGNLSTNAGGLRLFRYGNLHGSVLGLEVVLASGKVLDLMSTVKKDNTGYHLKNLFIGAEGTLGVITKVVIQCPPKPKSIAVAFLGLDKFEDVLETFREARNELGEILSACEMIDEPGFERTTGVFKLQNPLSETCRFYMLLETRSGAVGGDLGKLNDFAERMMAREVVRDCFATDEVAKVQKVWEIREKVAVAVFRDSYAYKYDISLPLKNFYTLVEIMRERLKGTSATLVTGYGHLGDGNLHLNVCSKEFDQSLKDAIEPYVFELTQKFKGSISAEHGIGLEKPGYLHFSKSPSSIGLMKEIKKLLDPKGILNPYKVLPP